MFVRYSKLMSCIYCTKPHKSDSNRKWKIIMIALFFDIDGTLVDIKTHKIPESTTLALYKAHELGNKIFIATGRSHTIVELPGLPKEIIDGYVTLNGAVCLADGKPVSLVKIPADTVKRLSEVCISRNFTCLFITIEGMKVANWNEQFEEGFIRYFNLESVPEVDFAGMRNEDVYQMTVFFDVETERELKPQFPELEFNRWFPTFADITCRGVDKALGIEAMSRHFGIGLADTVAFGDGGNDIPMLKKAAIGVAMGNASDEVKANADYVTADVDADGIQKALRHLGII